MTAKLAEICDTQEGNGIYHFVYCAVTAKEFPAAFVNKTMYGCFS